jgi:hypothetical protein
MSTDTGQTTGQAGAGKSGGRSFPGHLYAGALPAAGRTGQVE